jgi:hypothetical protein
MTIFFKLISFLFAVVYFSGCATILGGSQSKIKVYNGYPLNAEVYFNNEFKGNTPCEIKINKKEVKANGGIVTLKSNGFEDQNITLSKKTRGGFIFLDIIFGVVPIIVDAAAGNLSKVNPNKINYNLSPTSAESVIKNQVTKNVSNNNSVESKQAVITTNETVNTGVNNTSEKQNNSAAQADKNAVNTITTTPTTATKLVKEDIASAVVDMSFETKKISTKNTESADYRRSSLYTIMVQDPSQPYYDVIKNTFNNAPVPDKFNDHNLNVKFLNPDSIIINKNETAQKPAAEFMKLFKKELVHNLSGGVIDTTTSKEKDLPEKVNHFLAANDIAKAMVAKWFNRNKNGHFNMDLIADRGQYNASDMDVKVANSSARGKALLSDAGEELIGNTFILVSYFKYVSKEEIANKTNKVLSVAGNYLSNVSAGAEVATSVTSAAVTIAGKGYIVKTTSYLYQLNWNDSIASIFYGDYWVDKSSPDESRIKAFENSKLFNLKYIGSDVAWADLQSSIFTKKSEEDLISVATVKAVDAVIAKLQRNHEVFRTKTPLYSTDPLTAKIGLKEGVEAGDKFDVLEKNVDDTGRTYYKKLTTIKVDKKQIWDNRYMASEENTNTTIDRTLFDGSSKGLYPGLLIKQSK